MTLRIKKTTLLYLFLFATAARCRGAYIELDRSRSLSLRSKLVDLETLRRYEPFSRNREITKDELIQTLCDIKKAK